MNCLRTIDTRIVLVCAALLPTLAVMPGCGENPEDEKPATQVAARVNGDEITVHQINDVLERTQNITAEVADQAKRKILDSLIDRQLARQKAIEIELDRSPKVMQAIESAKSEILARAYFEDLAASIPAPQPSETEKYYSEHPELFAQRRLFDIEEFVFVASDDVVNSLRAHVAEGRSMPEIAHWLRSQGVAFTGNYGVRAAEQTSFEVLSGVQAMKAGEIQVFKTSGGRVRVIRVVNWKAEPLDEASANPRIQSFLMNRRATEIIAREIKELKELASIEYLGTFAGGESATGANVDAGTEDTEGTEETEGEVQVR